MPTLPVSTASMAMARAVCSPLLWRWGPLPWQMAQGFAAAMVRASFTMVSTGTPVVALAHWGVFGQLSGPAPMM